jgi:hypothetical protein
MPIFEDDAWTGGQRRGLVDNEDSAPSARTCAEMLIALYTKQGRK